MQICEKELCCGCSACEAVCPKEAVTMTADSEGFLRPVVDAERCVDCGLCQKKCPVNTKAPEVAKAAFAAYSKDSDIRKRSSSGGIFASLAKKIIDDGGAVFGAGFDENMKVCHYCAETEKDLYGLMGSKYVQSDMGDTYKKMAELLREGRTVLFTGSPCQVAGARNLFGENDRLYLMDFICHGVPTPLIWEKYLRDNFTKVTNASFRDKNRGWEEFSMRVESENGEYNCSRYTDPYIRMFLANVTLRPSCYSCGWKDPNFCEDITVGDFWGVSKINPAWNDNKGTSVVIIRTEQGEKLLDILKNDCFLAETDEKKSVSSNGMYSYCTPMPDNRDVFFRMLKDDAPFAELKDKFGKPLPGAEIIKVRIKNRIKMCLGAIARLKRK